MKHCFRRKALITVLFFITCVLCRLINWIHITFAGMTLDKIVFELNVPLKGTNKDTVWSAIIYCLLPALIAALLLALVFFLNELGGKKPLYIRIKSKKDASGSVERQVWPITRIKTAALLLCAVVFILSVFQANSYLELFKYIDSQIHTSTFIEDHYVTTEKVKMTFPENKRNLILIYLESMESTYADTASGGAFEENYIPELTDLAERSTSLSKTALRGGALPGAGTQWTIGALFSSSTGRPLLLPVESNSMSDYTEFFPGVTGLGDILEDNGYRNVFFIGSDADFGGRRLFYNQHGSYEIYDYFSAKDEGLIPADYNVWWGYEDEKLFSFAKDKLLSLGQSDQPFNFTLLTVDTHFPDGYVCTLCSGEADDQYTSVIACSSKQVYDFVTWIEQQDFYENTTIVITGDHQTMNTALCADVPEEKRSIYNCFINAVPVISRADTQNRQFSPLDLFPTILGSLGVQIEGDRLGLGVNLFSRKETLYEKYGPEISDQLRMKSVYYNNTFIYGQ